MEKIVQGWGALSFTFAVLALTRLKDFKPQKKKKIDFRKKISRRLLCSEKTSELHPVL
jgi:hypothetical protein